MAWELWGKNRVSILTAFCAMALALIPSVMLPPTSAQEHMLPLSAVLFMILFLLLVSIFTHPEFQFRGAYAGFPARKFTLPMRTRSLVAWHMIYGLVALGMLWMAMYLFIWLPAGIEPAWWLLPLLAVSLVWIQAICWAIPRPPLLQVIALCIVFPLLKFALELTAGFAVPYLRSRPWFAGHVEFLLPVRTSTASDRPFIISLFSSLAIAAGYLFAVVGVSRVRHGMAQHVFWGMLALSAIDFAQSAIGALPRWSGLRSSPGRAQFWYEIRRRGVLFLPLFAGFYLAFITLVMGPFASPEALVEALFMMAGLLLLTAYCIGYGIGKPSFWGDLGFTSWEATRPVSSGVLALARMQAGVVTAYATWLLLFLLIPCWLWLVLGVELFQSSFLKQLTLLSLGAYGSVAFLALAALTWGQLTGGLCLSLTGRAWIVNWVTILSVGLLSIFLVSWRYCSKRPELTPYFWDFCFWIAGVLVALKLLAACYFLFSGLQRRLMNWREITPWLALWCLGAVSVIMAMGVFTPFLGSTTLVRHLALEPMPAQLSTLAAILALPLVRITAAPAAVAWSRHR
jgi:hypothetical protein